MIVYEATKKQFLQDSDNDDIEEVILQHFKAVTGKSVGNSEINSWKGSLGYMAKVLRDEEVPDDTGLAIEPHIPQTSKRIDITLTGRDESGAKNAVLVELKQWSKASATGKDAIVRTALGNGLREVVPPPTRPGPTPPCWRASTRRSTRQAFPSAPVPTCTTTRATV